MNIRSQFNLLIPNERNFVKSKCRPRRESLENNAARSPSASFPALSPSFMKETLTGHEDYRLSALFVMHYDSGRPGIASEKRRRWNVRSLSSFLRSDFTPPWACSRVPRLSWSLVLSCRELCASTKRPQNACKTSSTRKENEEKGPCCGARDQLECARIRFHVLE